jgi:beta-lactamase superfamily II metal-dependent hydrolase
MKLSVFQAGPGDCLLVSSDGHHILVDGGLKGSFIEFTRPALAKIAEQDEKLDLVCVSHIDSDHISGIIQLINDVLAWRVFRFQQASGNDKFRQPNFPEPPEISEIWHNSIETQIGALRNEFEETVTMQFQASILGQNDLLAQAAQNLITGERQAIELSKLVDPSLLNLPVNKLSEGQSLVLPVDEPVNYQVGKMNLHLLGPFHDDLEQLHREWMVWLRANQRKLRSLQENVEESKNRLGLTAEMALGKTIEALTAELGSRTDVTTPNLASITFMIEENGRTILLTGDAHSQEILKGLRLHGFLPEEGGTTHVNVLKIQHHGAEANINKDFCKSVTADHYVFSGNGTHSNPELAIVELVVNSRLEEDGNLTPFTLWFNSSEADAGTGSQAEHMRQVREKVAELVKGREDVVLFKFIDGQPAFEIDLEQ